MTRSLPRLAFGGFAIAMLIVYGVVSWLTPLQAEDWTHWTWSARHVGDSPWAWITSHYTLSDAIGYTLAHSTLFHAIATPLVCLALVIGTFTVAMRRLPRPDSWDDVLGVIMISAAIWISQPRPGFVLFHRPYVAWHVYGCALAAWTIAPFVCGWRIRGGWTVLFALGAFLVGGTTRQIATATLIALTVTVLRTPREQRARWMWIALGALFAGTVVGFIDAPHVEFWKVFNRGLEQNLLVMIIPVREGGQIVTLVMLLVLAKLVLEMIWPAQSPESPDPRKAHRWFWIWFAICVLALFGPRFSEATVLPATLVLAAAALPWLSWLMSSRPLRYVIATFAVGLHVVMWATALATFVVLGGDFRGRLAMLESTPKGGVGLIRPFSEVLPTAWFLGEDWQTANRQLLAIEVFGLRDIEFITWFRKVDANPRLAIRLEVDGATDDQVRDAAPAIWATDPTNARAQFDVFARSLEQTAGKAFAARLVIDNLPFPERAGRPLYAAWYEDGQLTAPRTTRTNPDANDRMSVGMPAALSDRLAEGYVVRDGKGTVIGHGGGGFRLQPMEVGLLAIVTCDAKRCFAVDAFFPKF